ncbi:hypothetical protein, partial [Actinomadura fibrosa]
AAVAARLHDGGLLASARAAYVDGMDAVLGACAVGALAVGALLWAFQPGRPREDAAAASDDRESDHEHVAS